MSEKLILARYGEIFLKSDPVRRMQERQLKGNIKHGLRKARIKSTVTSTRGRIFVSVDRRNVDKACGILGKTFGIVSFSVCDRIESSEKRKIQGFVRKNYPKWVPRGKKFAVRGRRSGSQKENYTSMDIGKFVGDVVNRKVDLTNPEVEIFVEVRGNETFVYTGKTDGPGGLPVGVSGDAVCLLSGGIDSPVAAWMMMKRGCRVTALYADNGEYSDKKSLKRTREVLSVLQSWSNGWQIPLYSFDNSPVLSKSIGNKKVHGKYICLLCKRMMYRVANELAARVGASAIVTGETLGEVASQTIYNLRVLDNASGLPVFRPLIGNDKQENIHAAVSIGTFEKSISISASCGAVPSQPRTKGTIEEIEKVESMLPMKSIISKSVKSLEKL